MPTPLLPTVLIVDDAPENLGVLTALLQPTYRVLAATSGEKALAIAASQPRPDLILLDVMMPGMDGHEVFQRLQQDATTASIPVIFVTACDELADELKGFEAGAVDYISKPITPPLLLARVRTQLELKQARDLLANQNAWLEAEVSRRMRENDLTELVSIRALAHLAETRDPETGNHILRTQAYVHALATHLSKHPRFQATLSTRFIDLLTRSAPLHDIGKVGIPDAILHKPGPLTPDEWVVMRTHARLGVEAIELAESDVEQPVAFLAVAKQIAGGHHEKWDGSGYPAGLAGDDIPLAARLMALADVFDALITRRVYKPAMSFDEAQQIIRAGRGTHFDPDIVDAFLELFEVFTQIALRHHEPD